MIHSMVRFYDHHALAFTIVNWIWLISVFVMHVRLALRKPQHTLEVTLTESEADGALEITVVRQSSKPATIRRIFFKIDSDDLTSSKKRVLGQRLMLTQEPAPTLIDSAPFRFSLMRYTPGNDAPQTVNLRELAAVLSELGVETANVTGVVVDEKGFAYRSNPLHIPVYQMCPAAGMARFTDPRSVTV